MQDKHKSQPNAGLNLNLGDIYHVLFRHKWKIISIWILGTLIAIGLHFTWPVPYSSEARLYVRYVQDNGPITAVGVDPNTRSTTSGAESVINAEGELLHSLDVAKSAAETLNPEVLAKLMKGTNSYTAAAIIQGGLDVGTASRNPVMHVFFQHGDPDIVEPVLKQIIESYFKLHKKAHQVDGSQDENLTMTTDQLKGQLAQTEEALRKLKNQNDVTELHETKQLNAETLAKLKEDLWAAETELAEHQAILNALTNIPGVIKTDTNSSAPQIAAVPGDKISEYKGVCSVLDTLQRRKNQLRPDFTDQNPRMRAVMAQIETNLDIKSKLESEYPQLTAPTYQDTLSSSTDPSSKTSVSIALENYKIVGLKTKIARFNEHLKETREQIEKISSVEEKIKDLERLRDTQEANLKTFENERFKTRMDELVSDGKLLNIAIIQQPSPPFKDTSKLKKLVTAVFLGSIVAGLALAFAIELYFDRSFKRPIEIETKLGLPLFVSIPELIHNGKHRINTRKVHLLGAGNGNGKNSEPETPPPAGATELAPWKSNPAMQPFFEALRDRLITFFELKDIIHKPKLVAITSCSEGSGVSTVASGLAASLSETGEGNVLLVDMNTVNGSAHFFHHGKLACGLDDVLEKNDKRENAQVEKNLYVVTDNSADTNLPRILHKRFSALIPKLHASDFDYIIFDMPPVSQTSATTRVARFMDMVFMVVEAEKTDRDIVKRASKMLTEAKAENVGVVLNRSHNYVPKRLNQEL